MAEESEDNTCVVCGENTDGLRIQLSDCKHICCLVCLRRWSLFGAQVIPDDANGARLSTKDPTCPACRQQYHFKLCFADRKVQSGALLLPRSQTLLMRTVTCPKCKRSFQSNEIERVQCTHCHARFKHERTWTATCPECQIPVKYSCLFDHAMQCVKVPCPACEKPFADFATHVRRECTRVPVMCCGATGTFEEMQAHKRSGILACGLNMFR